MLGQAPATDYDLRFEALGIPVRVHPMFWLITALLGLGGMEGSAQSATTFLLLWVVCVFVSILVHELGHALVARHFGYRPEIVLYHMGGYASFSPTWGHSTSRSILISLAGPFAGFALFFVIFGLGLLLTANGVRLNEYSARFFWYMTWINLAWGLINLLPVLPLDGGQVCRDFLMWWSPRHGYQTALQISVIAAGGVAVLFLIRGDMFTAMFFGLLCLNSVQAQGSWGGGRGW